jgi:predicted dehydrogenase
MSRRDFVKAASSVAAAIPLGFAAAQDAPRTYRACVIGHTGRGWYGHGLDVAFEKFSHVTVVGVADPDEKGRLEAAKRTKAVHAYADYREMLEKEKPNLVAICPYYVERRLEMVRAAAEAGAHVFLEKPMARSLEEADAMVAVAEKHKIKSVLAHQPRVAPSILYLKKRLDEGLIGDLLEVRTRGKEDGRAGGEDLMVLGWHCLYLMRFFAGEPLWCSARVTQGGREITVDDRRAPTMPIGPVAGDAIHASYAFPGGVMGHFASQKNHGGGRGSDFQVVLYGAKGVVQIHIAGAHVYHLADPLWSPGRSGAAWQPLAPPQGGGGGNPALVADLLRAIETDGESVASLREGRAVLEMIMGVYASHLQGGRASFPLKDRTHPLGSF